MRSILVLLILLFTVGVAYAEPNPDAQETDTVKSDGITVQPGEVLLQVSGVVCSFCAYGVTKSLSKLSFVDSSKYKKGVWVDIDNQKVIIAIKPDHTSNLQEIYDAVKSGGYEPISAHTLDADGKLLVKKWE